MQLLLYLLNCSTNHTKGRKQITANIKRLDASQFEEFIDALPTNGYFLPDLGKEMRAAGIGELVIPFVPCTAFLFGDWGEDNKANVTWSWDTYMACALVNMRGRKDVRKVAEGFMSHTALCLIVTDVGYAETESGATAERFIPLEVRIDHEKCFDGNLVLPPMAYPENGEVRFTGELLVGPRNRPNPKPFTIRAGDPLFMKWL